MSSHEALVAVRKKQAAATRQARRRAALVDCDRAAVLALEAARKREHRHLDAEAALKRALRQAASDAQRGARDARASEERLRWAASRTSTATALLMCTCAWCMVFVACSLLPVEVFGAVRYCAGAVSLSHTDLSDASVTSTSSNSSSASSSISSVSGGGSSAHELELRALRVSAPDLSPEFVVGAVLPGESISQCVSLSGAWSLR
jgi:hypothetical protein